jgi:SAM-dependent methyltransferase
MSKINLGCGRDYREGFLNIDYSRECRADVYLDLRYDTLPVKDGGTELVYASGVLEQLQANEELLHAMNEAHRVLKSGGKFEIVVPNAENSIAWQDPFDCRRFTPETFQYFIKDSRPYKLYGSVYGFKPWTSVMLTTNPRGIMEVTLIK